MKTTAEILKLIDTKNSGYIYYYTRVSIQDELKNLQEVMTGLSPQDELYDLLTVHKSRTLEFADIMKSRPDGPVIYSAKDTPPPRPCPGDGSSSCYIGSYISCYNRVTNDIIKYFINGKEFVVEDYAYDPMIKMQTYKIQGNPEYHVGDTVKVVLPVSYRDNSGNIVSEVIEQVIEDPRY